jgi:hypothetical protein
MGGQGAYSDIDVGIEIEDTEETRAAMGGISRLPLIVLPKTCGRQVRVGDLLQRCGAPKVIGDGETLFAIVSIPFEGISLDVNIIVRRSPSCVSSADSFLIVLNDYLAGSGEPVIEHADGYDHERALHLLQHAQFYVDADVAGSMHNGLFRYVHLLGKGYRPDDPFATERAFVGARPKVGKLSVFLAQHYPSLEARKAFLLNLERVVHVHSFLGKEALLTEIAQHAEALTAIKVAEGDLYYTSPRLLDELLDPAAVEREAWIRTYYRRLRDVLEELPGNRFCVLRDQEIQLKRLGVFLNLTEPLEQALAEADDPAWFAVALEEARGPRALKLLAHPKARLFPELTRRALEREGLQNVREALHVEEQRALVCAALSALATVRPGREEERVLECVSLAKEVYDPEMLPLLRAVLALVHPVNRRLWAALVELLIDLPLGASVIAEYLRMCESAAFKRSKSALKVCGWGAAELVRRLPEETMEAVAAEAGSLDLLLALVENGRRLPPDPSVVLDRTLGACDKPGRLAYVLERLRRLTARTSHCDQILMESLMRYADFTQCDLPVLQTAWKLIAPLPGKARIVVMGRLLSRLTELAVPKTKAVRALGRELLAQAGEEGCSPKWILLTLCYRKRTGEEWEKELQTHGDALLTLPCEEWWKAGAVPLLTHAEEPLVERFIEKAAQEGLNEESALSLLRVARDQDSLRLVKQVQRLAAPYPALHAAVGAVLMQTCVWELTDVVLHSDARKERLAAVRRELIEGARQGLFSTPRAMELFWLYCKTVVSQAPQEAARELLIVYRVLASSLKSEPGSEEALILVMQAVLTQIALFIDSGHQDQTALDNACTLLMRDLLPIAPSGIHVPRMMLYLLPYFFEKGRQEEARILFHRLFGLENQIQWIASIETWNSGSALLRTFFDANAVNCLRGKERLTLALERLAPYEEQYRPYLVEIIEEALCGLKWPGHVLAVNRVLDEFEGRVPELDAYRALFCLRCARLPPLQDPEDFHDIRPKEGIVSALDRMENPARQQRFAFFLATHYAALIERKGSSAKWSALLTALYHKHLRGAQGVPIAASSEKNPDIMVRDVLGREAPTAQRPLDRVARHVSS